MLEELTSQLGYDLIALFDNNRNLTSPIPSVPLFFGWDEFENWRNKLASESCHYLIAIGGHAGSARLRMFEKLQSCGLVPATVVHPQALVSASAVLDVGCQILIGAVLGSRVIVGRTSIINTRSSIDHECVIGHGVHIAPGCTLCGCVVVEDAAFVGAGTTVLPRLTIGAGSIIGAGSVVTKNIPPGVVAIGSPAKVRRDA